MAIVPKRTIMTLYSDTDVYSHRVRIVLAAKGVNVEIIPVVQSEIQSEALTELRKINPYDTIPTLVDRDLVLYEADIITEYLDERFPHPPLLPVYPVARAEARKMMYRIEQDWYNLLYKIENSEEDEQAREYLVESLVNLEPVFADKQYFLSDEFSLMDAALAPLLWRLPQLGVIIPEEAKSLIAYMQRIFKLDYFQTSLTDAEKQWRAA